MGEQKMKKNKGRPTTYTKEIATEICRRIAEGETLTSIVKDQDMPNRDSFYQWLLKKEGLTVEYTTARQRQADFYADNLLTIASNVGLTSEEIAKARLKIDTMKWIVCKLHPRAYADKGITINNNTQINNNIHEKFVLEQYDVKEIEEDQI